MRGATEPWATWLALAARERMGTTWGIGEGAAAGPTNPYGDPPGHAWLAIAGPDGGVRTKHVLTGLDDRPTNMVEFAKAAIALLDACLGPALTFFVGSGVYDTPRTTKNGSGTGSMASMTTEDDIALFALRVWGYKQGESVSLLVHIGDRLGLYRALDDAGPTTADQLAERTGLDARWLLEWLRGNAAAELLESNDGVTFELSSAGAEVLAREDTSLWFAAGAFTALIDASIADDITESFQTGVGVPYDRHGPQGAHLTERSLGPWARLALLPRIVPALDGVQAKLERGALVADVGCGAGVALTTLARAFPSSTFHGYDLSRHALDRARARIADEGLDNVELFATRAEDLPSDGRYDFMLTLDCLHDMTRPADAIDAIRDALATNGTWLIKDIRCDDSWAVNRNNPMLAMMYGFSLLTCMSSALSEPGGAGLGTLGFTRQRAEAMTRAAGFTQFRVHDFDDPANLYYEVHH